MKMEKSAGAVEAMEVAEASRETEWEKPSFVGDLFLGNLNLDLIHPFPDQPAEDKAIGDEYVARLGRFLAENVDPDEIDRTGDFPPSILRRIQRARRVGNEDPERIRRASGSA